MSWTYGLGGDFLLHYSIVLGPFFGDECQFLLQFYRIHFLDADFVSLNSIAELARQVPFLFLTLSAQKIPAVIASRGTSCKMERRYLSLKVMLSC